MNKKSIQALFLTAALSAVALAADVQKLDRRIEAAHEVLHELMDTPDKGIPNDIAQRPLVSPLSLVSKRAHFLSALSMVKVWSPVAHRGDP